MKYLKKTSVAVSVFSYRFIRQTPDGFKYNASGTDIQQEYAALNQKREITDFAQNDLNDLLSEINAPAGLGQTIEVKGINNTLSQCLSVLVKGDSFKKLSKTDKDDILRMINVWAAEGKPVNNVYPGDKISITKDGDGYYLDIDHKNSSRPDKHWLLWKDEKIEKLEPIVPSFVAPNSVRLGDPFIFRNTTVGENLNHLWYYRKKGTTTNYQINPNTNGDLTDESIFNQSGVYEVQLLSQRGRESSVTSSWQQITILPKQTTTNNNDYNSRDDNEIITNNLSISGKKNIIIGEPTVFTNTVPNKQNLDSIWSVKKIGSNQTKYIQGNTEGDFVLDPKYANTPGEYEIQLETKNKDGSGKVTHLPYMIEVVSKQKNSPLENKSSNRRRLSSNRRLFTYKPQMEEEVTEQMSYVDEVRDLNKNFKTEIEGELMTDSHITIKDKTQISEKNTFKREKWIIAGESFNGLENVQLKFTEAGTYSIEIIYKNDSGIEENISQTITIQVNSDSDKNSAPTQSDNDVINPETKKLPDTTGSEAPIIESKEEATKEPLPNFSVEITTADGDQKYSVGEAITFNNNTTVTENSSYKFSDWLLGTDFEQSLGTKEQSCVYTFTEPGEKSIQLIYRNSKGLIAYEDIVFNIEAKAEESVPDTKLAPTLNVSEPNNSKPSIENTIDEKEIQQLQTEKKK